MRMQLLIIFCMFLFGCTRTQKQNNIQLISPVENFRQGKIELYVIDKTDEPDSIIRVKAASYFENQYVVASDSGIYIIDMVTKKVKKYLKFRFNELDSIENLEVHWIKFIPNSDNTKLLITTSSGQSTKALIFQIDLASLKIDWLSEFDYQIVAGRYSTNGNQIAFGTIYHQKQTSGDTAVYHSSLFLVNSKDGSFMDYFNQGESMEEIKFSHNDQYIYAVLGWPHVDTYVWEVQNKKATKGVYGKDNTAFYDATSIDQNSFVSIGADGIYRWNMNDPENYSMIANLYINGNSKIYEGNELNQSIILNYTNGSINPPSMKFYDKQWKITDSLSLNCSFNNQTYNGITITGISESDTIVVFNLKEKKVARKIHVSELLH